MTTRPIRVWNGTAWEDVAIAPFDSTAYLSAANASATYATQSSYAPLGRNLIINGAMNVHARGTSVADTGTGYATADRWRQTIGGTTGAFTQSIETDAPTGSGFRKSLKMLCTTAAASPSSTAQRHVQQYIEGQNLQAIKKGTSSAEQLSLSFWVKSNVTGTYVAWLYDEDNNRTVSATYSISASATWERKVITFPSDTTGALDNDSSTSLRVSFALVAGSDFTSGTLATTWQAYSDANAFVGQTNLAAATNNYWQVTGVQLEVGPVATPFEFEPYEATLRKCQRYYYLHVSGADKTIAGGHYDGASQVVAAVDFPTTMRTAPSLTVATGTNYYRMTVDNSTNDDFNSLTVTYASENTAIIYNNSEVSGTTGKAGYLLTKNASSSIAFSAEL